MTRGGGSKMEFSPNDFLKLIFYIFLCVIAVRIIIAVFRDKDICPKCNGRLVVYKITHPLGINITNKVIIGVGLRSGGKTIYKCKKCNSKYVYKDGHDEPQACSDFE